MARARLADYVELTKPRLASLALFSTFVGFYLGSEGDLNFPMLLTTLIGTALVAASAMALNQWMESSLDRKMSRTASRPIPAGRLSPEAAYRFGVILAVLGFVILAKGAGPLPVWIATLIFASYLLLYTPLKTRTALCTLVGAIPGALPPLIGWSAARGHFDSRIWVLCAMIFLWQMPHFLAIAWLYREDFKSAGFQMLSSEDPDGRSVGGQMLLYGTALLPVSLLPTFVGLTGPLYFWTALLSGSAMFLLWLTSLKQLDRRSKLLFRASIAHLTILLVMMVLDKV